MKNDSRKSCRVFGGLLLNSLGLGFRVQLPWGRPFWAGHLRGGSGMDGEIDSRRHGIIDGQFWSACRRRPRPGKPRSRRGAL